MESFLSLFKSMCPFCREAKDIGSSICPVCVENLMRLDSDPALNFELHGLRITAAATYEGWLQGLILRQKQSPHPAVIRWLAHWLWSRMPLAWKTSHAVWIPGRPFQDLHLVEALLLELYKLGLRPTPKSLIKRRLWPAKPQKSLNQTERNTTGLERKFAVIHRYRAQTDQKFILLDDVVTTGSTMLHSAQLLREKLGLEIIGGLALAYTELKNKP